MKRNVATGLHHHHTIEATCNFSRDLNHPSTEDECARVMLSIPFQTLVCPVETETAKEVLAVNNSSSKVS